jgi:hypothetical protein
MIVMFGLSQTSSLIISLTNQSKTSNVISQDAEEESENEKETEKESEFDSFFEFYHHSLSSPNSTHKVKQYSAWKASEYSIAESLPEIPPPDCL